MKKLTLAKETIRDLSKPELDQVAGGATLLVSCGGTCGQQSCHPSGCQLTWCAATCPASDCC